MSFVPVTVQVLDVNDNAPYIATDNALIVCEGYKAGQVSYLLSFLSVLFFHFQRHSVSTCHNPSSHLPRQSLNARFLLSLLCRLPPLPYFLLFSAFCFLLNPLPMPVL